MFGYGSTKGQLLVASPPLGDPNFDRTVVFMLEHTGDGAVGLVVNRPEAVTTLIGMDAWTERMSPPATVFAGGPVETDALIAVAVVDAPNDEGWSPIHPPSPTLPAVGTVDLGMEPEDVAGSVDRLRIFRGYSGWGPSQLESELAVGAWMVLGADLDDLFSEQPDELWRDVLRRQGGRLAWIAEAPDDLSAN